jgi:hypothetical protein
MSEEKALTRTHPEGERELMGDEAGEEPLAAATSVDTFAGKIHVKWVPEAAVSAFGQMAFFIEFLKTSGLFEAWVNLKRVISRFPIPAGQYFQSSSH